MQRFNLIDPSDLNNVGAKRVGRSGPDKVHSHRELLADGRRATSSARSCVAAESAMLAAKPEMCKARHRLYGMQDGPAAAAHVH
jgi:hypothetical protein